MLGEHCLQVVLSTDDHDFTDFCYVSGWGRARVPGGRGGDSGDGVGPRVGPMILVLLGTVNSGVSRC